MEVGPPRVDITTNPQIKNHRKGGLLFGGGGGNRLVSRCSRCIARPLGQRQAMLDETLTSPVLAPSGAKPLRWQQARLLKPHLHPRVPRVRFPSIRIINKEAIQNTDGIFIDGGGEKPGIKFVHK